MNIAFDTTLTWGVVVTVVLAIIGWSRARWKAVDTRADALTARLDRHDQRLTAAEQAINGMPGKEDMHGLQLALMEVRGEIRSMAAGMSGQTDLLRRLEKVVDRQENHLMGRKQ